MELPLLRLGERGDLVCHLDPPAAFWDVLLVIYFHWKKRRKKKIDFLCAVGKNTASLKG